jgi:N-acylneuraminate cytidylyltransferase
MKKIAIIPARGGSRRIPRKNIKDFLGKPIIAYSIEAAVKSGLFDEIMVSTDDQEISEVAKKHGASVPFLRSAKNSDDKAAIEDVLGEVIAEYLMIGKFFDFVCCILPTAPLLKIENLKEGLDILIDGNFDSVRPIVNFSYPVQRGIKLEGNKVRMAYPEYENCRSQDLEKMYYDAGQFYWMTGEAKLGKNRGALIISEVESQDIDNEMDWKIAELKYKLIYEKIDEK